LDAQVEFGTFQKSWRSNYKETDSLIPHCYGIFHPPSLSILQIHSMLSLSIINNIFHISFHAAAIIFDFLGVL
jgi:hypothetical protein